MRLKILSVDFHLKGSGIENYSFWDGPSFSDYDVVIVDPGIISNQWVSNITPERDGKLCTYVNYDHGFGKGIKNLLKRREVEIGLLLGKTGGILICILKQITQNLIIHEGGYESTVNNYSWLPNLTPPFTFLTPIKRQGESIKLLDNRHAFSQYFSASKENIYYEAVIGGKILELRTSKLLAVNKVEELVGCETSAGKGKIIFLPPLKKVDEVKVGGIFIDCIRKSLQWTEPLKKPDWITKYSLSTENNIKDAILELKKELKKIEEAIDKKEKELKSLELIKSLLYEQGKYGLEPAVRESFKLIGFNVIQPEDYEEEYDLLIKEKYLTIIGEIEGSNKKIGVDKYRQLLDYTDNRLTKGENIKGILIGNGFIDIDPETRKEQFTDEAIRGCKSKKFCRITTIELFKAARVVLDDSSCREGIKRLIIDCDAEFKLQLKTS